MWKIKKMAGPLTQLTKLQVSSDNHLKPSSCQWSILPSMCPYTMLTHTIISSQNRFFKIKKTNNPKMLQHSTAQSLVPIISLDAAAQLVSATAWLWVPGSSIPLGHCAQRWGCRADFDTRGWSLPDPPHTCSLQTHFLPQPPSLSPASPFCFD